MTRDLRVDHGGVMRVKAIQMFTCWLRQRRELKRIREERTGINLKLLSKLGDLNDICIWTLHLNTGELNVGQALAELIGLTPQPGWNPVDEFKSRVHEEDWRLLVSECERIRSHPPGKTYDQLIRLLNGAGHWVNARLNGVIWSNGDNQPPTHIIALLTIATGSAKTSSHHIGVADVEEDVIRSLPTGIWRWNKANRRLHVSQSVIQLLRVPLTQAASQPPWWISRVHPDDAVTLLDSWNASVQAQSPFFSHECRWRDGEERTRNLIIRASIAYDAQSAAEIHSVTGSVEDVTEYRRMESELRERNKQLRSIFESSPIAYVALDSFGHIRYVNQAFSTHLGVAPNIIMGAHETKLIDVIRSAALDSQRLDSVRGAEEMVRVVASKRPSILDVRVNGTIKHLGVDFICSQLSEYTSILVVRDVTQEHQVERMKSQFMSTAAHELRTSMSSILGYSELLNAKKTTSNELQEACIKSIHQQAERLTDILDDLLSLSKLESTGIEQFDIREIDLREVVQRVVDEFRTPDGRFPPRINIVSTKVYADASKTYQAILNLISNAFKYSKSGYVDVHLECDVNFPDKVILSIRDQGIGIPPDALSKVFDRFYRVDPACSVHGTGLGLSIVKEIMLAMKGQVEIESEMGVGTTVKLLFRKNMH